jgi:hypothetical protein
LLGDFTTDSANNDDASIMSKFVDAHGNDGDEIIPVDLEIVLTLNLKYINHNAFNLYL